MSALGQKLTCAVQNVMSALHPKADMCGAKWDVRYVPIADIVLLKRADPMTTLFHQPSNGSHCRRRRAEEAKATSGRFRMTRKRRTCPQGCARAVAQDCSYFLR